MTADGGQVRFHVKAPKRLAETLYSALDALFEEDGLPLAINDFDEDAGIHEVSLYAFDDLDAIERQVVRIAAEIGPDLVVEREALPDINWVARSLEGLKPVRAGRFLVHGAHDRHRRQVGDLAIEIEAGLAFGTGHHGTTAGCLEMILDVARRERPRRVLDLGTGSGVLAIAIAKLLPARVLATDIDPVATRVAAGNVELNGVRNRVRTVTAAGFHHPALAAARPFDLIVANILARPLIRVAPQMAAHVATGGSLILSGILERQREAVLSAYVGHRFRHVRTLRREGWVTLHLKR